MPRLLLALAVVQMSLTCKIGQDSSQDFHRIEPFVEYIYLKMGQIGVAIPSAHYILSASLRRLFEMIDSCHEDD